MPEEALNTDALFSVKTEVFEGPLELLIELIEKRKLLINDISLVAVTDEYMRRVALMEQGHMKETAEFIVLAATLLLLKSKSLLPVLELTDEEEENIEDLQERLKLYQIYRNAGQLLAEVFGTHVSYERQFVQDTTPLFLPDSFTEKETLGTAIREVILKLPKKIVKPKVQVRKTVSLEEMMHKLEERIVRQMKFGFRDFTGHSQERGTIIVGFLAVLEMVKQGSVMVTQIKHFEDIEIEREGTQTPKYM